LWAWTVEKNAIETVKRLCGGARQLPCRGCASTGGAAMLPARVPYAAHAAKRMPKQYIWRNFLEANAIEGETSATAF